MNTDRIRMTYSVLMANNECLDKRINRYMRNSQAVDLTEAINKLDRMQECIEIIRKEICNEITMKGEVT